MVFRFKLPDTVMAPNEAAPPVVANVKLPEAAMLFVVNVAPWVAKLTEPALCKAANVRGAVVVTDTSRQEPLWS